MTRLQVRYEDLARAYLSASTESVLEDAYEFGREALSLGLGVLDIVEIHHLARRGIPGEHGQRIQEMLIECLAPFEVAFRGFREANEELRGLIESLKHANTQLSQAHSRERSLAEASGRLALSLDVQETVLAVLSQALEHLTDRCILELAEAHGAQHESYVGRCRGHGKEMRFSTVKHVFGSPVCLGSLSSGRERPALGASLRIAIPRETGKSLLKRRWQVFELKTGRRRLGRLALAPALRVRHDPALVQEFMLRASVALDNAFLYREAHDAVQAREDMVNVVSHDLKNPLSAIRLNAEILARGRAAGKPEMVKAVSERILGGTKRMTGMIEDILDLGRINSGRFHVNLEERLTSVLVNEALTMMGLLADSKRIRLVASLECPEVALRCDFDRVLQVFSNLIGNSLKYTPEGGEIAVRARRLDRFVLFSVKDTGVGIAAENLPHVFDRLWQARPDARAGIGFGLFIARAIIEAHGGAICPDSVPGEGSTFFFTLPLAG